MLKRAGGSRVLRAIEFGVAARRLAREGYPTFFLRYSRTAATVLLLLRRFVPLRLLYWASGQATVAQDRSALQTASQAFGKWHFRWICRHADAVFTGPERMTEYMARTWGIPRGKVHLLYNDVDPTRFRPLREAERVTARRASGWARAEFVVLFVHHLSPRRGSRLLLPFAERLRQRVGDRFRLVVVGDGPDLDFIRERSKTSQAHHLIDVRGPIPNRELPAIYGASDSFLMPSFDEGFPRVVLEAMATGMPVVATRAGGTEDVLGHSYPFLTEPGDIEGLVEMTASLMADPEAGERAGSELRARVLSRYSTDRVARMLLDELRATG